MDGKHEGIYKWGEKGIEQVYKTGHVTDTHIQGWNKEVTAKVGLPLMEGITEFFAGDYAKAVEILNPVMPDVQKMIQGSGAQKDISQQILHHSCMKSGTPGDLAIAREMMDQKLVRRKIKEHTPLNKRFMEKMMTVHETQG